MALATETEKRSVALNTKSPPMYDNGTMHDCNVCGLPIITLFSDPECKTRVGGDETCWPCEEFGGPIDDMDLWDS